jgi:type III pantothenate kinase
MNLLIDSGNTYTKAALCDEQKIIELIKVNALEDLKKIAEKYSFKTVIISSVNKEAAEILGLFPKSKTILLNSNTPVPIKNLYKTPSTLGVDRLAGVIGASTLFPGAPCLCIDAGTCLTYDLIDAQAQYLGGSIAPGIEMRFKALHTFTARLPLVERQEKEVLIGTTTEESILSGVQTGILKEMEGVINDYKTRYKGLKIIITGGDSGFFESRIKDTIFVVQDLLFLGLKRIIEYNAA